MRRGPKRPRAGEDGEYAAAQPKSRFGGGSVFGLPSSENSTPSHKDLVSAEQMLVIACLDRQVRHLFDHKAQFAM